LNYLAAFFVALVVAAVLTPLVRQLALSIGAVDKPDNLRKIHTAPVAYLGGVAIFIAFLASATIFIKPSRELVALLLGTGILVVLGVADDLRNISAGRKLFWQVVAAGIGIYTVTNPFGGQIALDWGRFAVGLGPIHFHITPVANFISLLWMVGMVNTINFLDGLDGLATGVSGIAATTIFALTISPAVHQPAVALLAVIVAGACLGFLPFNFFPARIFLGDAGAYFLGMTLALLAIYSGGKLATAGLVLGFTIIDALWAALRRLRRGLSPFSADREHLHHLLVAAGFSHRTAVLILYALASSFGLIALVSGTASKLVALVGLVGLTVVMISGLVRLNSRNSSRVIEKPRPK
jgi:UDP-GlcNAc:undecaprenyl-phosphate GlcNAc-1-phosphate transferase